MASMAAPSSLSRQKCIVNFPFLNLFCFVFFFNKHGFCSLTLAWPHRIVVGSESTRSLSVVCLLSCFSCLLCYVCFFVLFFACATQNDKINKIIRECLEIINDTKCKYTG